jgi:DNA repair protein SbcD/Mre11
MKLLHTADWHLGDRLGRIDRTGDLRRGVERIADYCRQEKIDVLLVAGDLFSELARPEGLRDAVRHIQGTFEGFLHDGGTILAVTGNHDNESFCQTLRHAMTLAAPTVGGFGSVVPPGRVYLTADPALLRLRDLKFGGDVQFVLMPYPTPSRLLTNDVLQRYGSFEQKNQYLQAAFAGRIRDMRADSRFDPRLPTVLMAHVNVRGAEVNSLFRISETEDVVFDDPALPANYAYVALGHIHKAQALGGQGHVRYCGSIDRMDLGEQHDSKGVVVFDLDDQGLLGTPATLPLDSAPMYEIEVRDAQAELPTLAGRYPDHETALVNLHVHYTAGVDSLEQVLRELEVIFPRWYSRDWTERSDLGPALTIGAAPPAKGFEDTVRDYLAAELQNHPEVDREAIIELADELLQEMT